MAQKNFTAAVRFQTAAFALVAALLLVGGSVEGFSQTPAQSNDLLPKESDKETVVEPVNASQTVKSPGDIKVVFDETAPGVVYIVSNGEKIRVDTTKKTVEQVTTDSPIANN
ncbi:MAG: hypothetical protein LH614_05340 [Pyrinomonadaceae bacterium]|nr:hypothetical protein [Pyrinomonadaceae bacterium]